MNETELIKFKTKITMETRLLRGEFPSQLVFILNETELKNCTNFIWKAKEKMTLPLMRRLIGTCEQNPDDNDNSSGFRT